MYKKVNLFGKDEDGEYEGRIEEIMRGRSLTIFGRTIIRESGDILCISNRHHPAWIFSLINGYRQIGTYKISYPHNFKEGQDVIVVKKDEKIVEIKE